MSDNAMPKPDSEWRRLTADSNRAGIWYRRLDGHIYPHRFSAEQMTDAEALAFTIATGNWRDVPEVRALVERVREMFKVLDEVYRDDPDWSVTSWLEEEPTATAARQALAKYEEAGGE
jgi:hypothetical protein